MDKTVSFIGAGKMAEAIISGLLSSKKITNAQVIISDKYDKRRREIEETYNVRSTPDNVVCAKEGTIVFLSVKPKDMAEVLIQCKPILRQSKLIVSIAAGIEIKFIESLLDKETKIIRVMPNIAVTVAEGMSVVMKNTAADASMSLVKTGSNNGRLPGLSSLPDITLVANPYGAAGLFKCAKLLCMPRSASSREPHLTQSFIWDSISPFCTAVSSSSI